MRMRPPSQALAWFTLYKAPALPESATPTQNGLLSDGTRYWWRHAGDSHEVYQPHANATWQLRRNDGRAGFSPSLYGNGDRAWRLAWHRPQQWPGRQRLLEYLWPEAETLDAHGLGRALDLLGFDEAFLRALVVEQRAIPVLLRDLLLGFTADARINRFFESLAQVQGPPSDSELWRFCMDHLRASAWPASEQHQVVLDATAALRQVMMKQLAETPVASHPQLALRRSMVRRGAV